MTAQTITEQNHSQFPETWQQGQTLFRKRNRKSSMLCAEESREQSDDFVQSNRTQGTCSIWERTHSSVL